MIHRPAIPATARGLAALTAILGTAACAQILDFKTQAGASTSPDAGPDATVAADGGTDASFDTSSGQDSARDGTTPADAPPSEASGAVEGGADGSLGSSEAADATSSGVADGALDSTLSDGGNPADAAGDALPRQDSGGDAPLPTDAAVDANGPGCSSDGGSVALGLPNPANECQRCDLSGWVSAREGYSCSGSGNCTAGSCAMPRSCSVTGAGRTNCGPGGSGSESCCTSLPVDGGEFKPWYSATDGAIVDQPYSAVVSDLRLDKYLVSVGRFRQFVAAVVGDAGAGWVPDAGSGVHWYLDAGGLTNAENSSQTEPGWDVVDDGYLAPTTANLLSCINSNADAGASTWTADAGPAENLPINCVTWQEAFAFCVWDGAFLPSNREWQYSVSGGARQRVYPWGVGGTVPANPQRFISGGDYTDVRGTPAPAPVGYAQLGGGVWGQLDLVGELWEWHLDVEDQFPPSALCADCANLTSPTGHPEVRWAGGGAYDHSTEFSSVTGSTGAIQWVRDYSIGFRCARSP